ncbi:MAG: tetratricopeptide repeat protein [Candidatus Hodarchaeales archaeon]|jgi:tetratricopeptide (TPR) repeat protein
MDIIILKELFEKGNYDDLINKISHLKKNDQFFLLNEEDLIKITYYNSQALSKLGRYQEALEIAKHTQTDFPLLKNNNKILPLIIAQIDPMTRLGQLEKAEKMTIEGEKIIGSETTSLLETEKYWIASFYHVTGNIFLFKGKLDTALEYYLKSLALKELINNPQDIAGTLCNIANIYFEEGELDLALKYQKRVLTIDESFGNPQNIAGSLNNIGNIYHAKNESRLALDYFQRSLELKESLGNLEDIALTLNNIGNIYRQKGELNTALTYFQRSLSLFESSGNPQFIAYSLTNIGEIHQQKMDFDIALSFLQRSLELRESIGNDLETIHTLFDLIIVNLDLEDVSQALNYLKQQELLYERTPEKFINKINRIAEALVYKKSKRARNKFKAQEILNEVLFESITENEYDSIAMIHLCELLLDELKIYGDLEVFEEVKNLLHRMYDFSKKTQSFSLMVNTMIMKAKFAFVDGNFQEALKFFDLAIITAEENELNLLIEKIVWEKRSLEEEFTKWHELIQLDVSIQQRLEQVRVVEYVKEAQKLVCLSKS